MADERLKTNDEETQASLEYAALVAQAKEGRIKTKVIVTYNSDEDIEKKQ